MDPSDADLLARSRRRQAQAEAEQQYFQDLDQPAEPPSANAQRLADADREFNERPAPHYTLENPDEKWANLRKSLGMAPSEHRHRPPERPPTGR